LRDLVCWFVLSFNLPFIGCFRCVSIPEFKGGAFQVSLPAILEQGEGERESLPQSPVEHHAGHMLPTNQGAAAGQAQGAGAAGAEKISSDRWGTVDADGKTRTDAAPVQGEYDAGAENEAQVPQKRALIREKGALPKSPTDRKSSAGAAGAGGR